MSDILDPDGWRPQGIEDLEPNAWAALRHDGSACVVAGPGSGKTEFLAQRAAYLFQSGSAHQRFRILAISFKRDAAANLQKRIRERCTPQQAARFDSLTFDAFTKGLVDRFVHCLPDHLRPTIPYDVAFPRTPRVRDLLESARQGAPRQFQYEISGIRPDQFEARYLGPRRLTRHVAPATTGSGFALEYWWNQFLRGGNRSALTFPMLNRLAELLQRENHQVAEALRRTYPYVFVDEFQDTTFAQFDLLQSTFGHSGGPVVTAVGDNKQRIMGWAGARSDAFDEFVEIFSAEKFALLLNHRSTAELVRLQHHVATVLDAGSFPAEARAQSLIDGEAASIWTYSDAAREGSHLANWIADDIDLRGTSPRDYVLLVKQKADEYEGYLKPALGRAGLLLRNEAREVAGISIQDMLVAPVTRLFLAALKLATSPRAPADWSYLRDQLEMLRRVDADDPRAMWRIEEEMGAFVSTLRDLMLQVGLVNEDVVDAVCDAAFEFFDGASLAREYPEYASGDYLAMLCQAIRIFLIETSREVLDWPDVVRRFEGVDSVPLMTVHKSKGLEYDTVICVGLDDGSWWSFKRQRSEGFSVMFVAMSRAKQRLIFTFTRDGRRSDIADLYNVLKKAGVRETALG